MITFNTLYRKNDLYSFDSVNLWLNAFYTESKTTSDKEITLNSLINLQEKIQYKFLNQNLLLESLTHKTFHYENKNLVSYDNEKLEFLGDAVLNLIISDYLYKNFSLLNEGQLSKLRVTLENEGSFARLGKFLNLSDSLFIGKGEYKNQGHLKDSLIADAFEALFGAISLEKSVEETKNIFLALITTFETETETKFIDLKSSEEYDSKSKLQELSMEKWGHTPLYKFQEIQNGFEVELWIGDKLIATKQGISKKKTEKELAKFALENI